MAISPGTILRNKREEKKLTLEQAAAGTNIRIHFLQAIEEDRLGAIASQTQLRGFTRLYASYLGVNPQDILEPAAPVQEAPVVETPQPDESTSPSILDKIKINTKINLPKREPVEKPLPPKRSIESVSNSVSAQMFREIGAELERQREALGLSRNDIERQIKIRELYVYALENGMIEDLPSTVQGRGMLNNYAAFMNLDPEPLQTRFAEGLQQRRLEKAEEELAKKKNPELKKYNAPITGWRRYLTPDLIIGGGVFVVLFVLIIWGAMQVIGSARLQAEPTAESISSILIGTDTPVPSTIEVTPEAALSTTSEGGEVVNTASVDLLATITAVGNKPIQVVVVAYQRAYLKVVSDGIEKFSGRVVPGGVYPFTGSSKITLTSGNAAAMQIYYNQQDLGILGTSGQVLNLDFTGNSMATVTPQYTAIPTATMMPTYTQQPTSTPTLTATPVTPTITPYRP